MPDRLFESLHQRDLLAFDEVLETLRVGPLTPLRDGNGQSLQEVADLVGLGDAVRERLFEHAIQDYGDGLIRFLNDAPDDELPDAVWGLDGTVAEPGRQTPLNAQVEPYAPGKDDSLAAQAVAVLSRSPHTAHQNLAEDLCCFISGEAFVPTGERMPVKLPDLVDEAGRMVARGSVMSRESARRYLAQFDEAVPDPGTRVLWKHGQILDSPGYADGDPQRKAVVLAVLNAFSGPGPGPEGRCEQACGAAHLAVALQSPEYRAAAARAAVGNLPHFRTLLQDQGRETPAPLIASRSSSPSH